MAINSIASVGAWSCMMIIIQKSSIIKCIEHDQTAGIIIRECDALHWHLLNDNCGGSVANQPRSLG